MWTSIRVALVVLVAALTINYVEPLPALLNRLWVQAKELPEILSPAGPSTGNADSQHVLSHSDTRQTEPRVSFRRRLVAVGDLHGDFANAQRVLKMAQVIDESGAWSGSTDIFVQTGDIVDRGPDTLVLYQMMETLRAQAKATGGEVVSTLGNHEVMNAIGDWRSVS